jgi:hypothetical protein
MIIPTKDISLNALIGSMVIDFPKDNIPLSGNEENWKDWASALLLESSFQNLGAPDPNAFKDRTAWAQAFFHSVASIS